MLHPNTSYYGILGNATAYYSILQYNTSCASYYSILQNTRAYHSILKSSTLCYITLQHTIEYQGTLGILQHTITRAQHIILHHTTAYYGILRNDMGYYITPCYITTSYYGILGHAMAYYNILQYSTSCYISLQHTTEYQGTPRHTKVYYCTRTAHHSTSHYFILRNTRTCHGLLLHTTSCYITLKHNTSCYISLQHTTEYKGMPWLTTAYYSTTHHNGCHGFLLCV